MGKNRDRGVAGAGTEAGGGGLMMRRGTLHWFTTKQIVRAFGAGASMRWLAWHTGRTYLEIQDIVRRDYLRRTDGGRFGAPA